MSLCETIARFFLHMYLQYKSFENNVGNGEVACNEQFLLLPQLGPKTDFFPTLNYDLFFRDFFPVTFFQELFS